MRLVKLSVFEDSRHSRTISSIVLSLIACLSFVAHLFFYSVSAAFYLILLGVLTFSYIAFKPAVFVNRNITLLLILAAISIFFSFWHSQQLAGSLMDVSVIFLGMLLVIFHTQKMGDYIGVMKVVSFFALFFAIGTIINSLMPGVYKSVLSIFPPSYASIVKQEAVNRVPGFSTNPGFSAGYISAGIIAIAAACQKDKTIIKSKVINLAVLVFAFMLTGKRGPALFLVVTLLLCYLIPTRGAQKIKRYWRLLLVVLLLLAIFLVFQDFLVTIPIISKILRTVSGLLAGEDVSSGRSKLYAWAIQLFLRHPLFGIGWGDYKTTVVGNATLVKTLDTHNIYLQLLCETGIVGFVVIVGMFLVLWNKTRKLFKECATSTNSRIRVMLPFIYFSFAYQTYFLLYGLTGNTLYDQNYQILYMISCAIMMTYQYNRTLIQNN